MVQSQASSLLSQFAFPPPSPTSLPLHLPLLFPPSMSSFYPATPCILSTAGQARSERQGEQSAPVMTACLSKYTFLSSPAPPPPPTRLPLCLSERQLPLNSHSFLIHPHPLTVITPLPPSPSSSSSISCSRPAVVIFPSSPCNPALALPSITGSSCPLSLPCICLKP